MEGLSTWSFDLAPLNMSSHIVGLSSVAGSLLLLTGCQCMGLKFVSLIPVNAQSTHIIIVCVWDKHTSLSMFVTTKSNLKFLCIVMAAYVRDSS